MDEMYRVVLIEGQGYGWMPPEDYAAIAEPFKRFVKTICFCKSGALARAITDLLPEQWRDEIKAITMGESDGKR